MEGLKDLTNTYGEAFGLPLIDNEYSLKNQSQDPGIVKLSPSFLTSSKLKTSFHLSLLALAL
jgi:hypothetical protein